MNTEITALPDQDLARLAWQHRREALQGNRYAFGLAHELEKELRRRAGLPSRPAALDDSPMARGVRIPTAAPRPWWRF